MKSPKQKKEEYVKPQITLEEIVAICLSKTGSSPMIPMLEITTDDYEKIGKLVVKSNEENFKLTRKKTK